MGKLDWKFRDPDRVVPPEVELEADSTRVTEVDASEEDGRAESAAREETVEKDIKLETGVTDEDVNMADLAATEQS